MFGQPDGGTRVLAFIEQAGPQLDGIKQAVGDLQAGQQALSAALGSLQAISMVSLGLAAITPVVLFAQFAALRRRLNAMEKQIGDVHNFLQDMLTGKLKTGLELIRQGTEFLDKADVTNAKTRFDDAVPICTESMKTCGVRLTRELKQPKVSREAIRLLARHLTFAVAGVAGCHVGLGHDHNAFAGSGEELDLLKQAARWMFDATVGPDPAPYLIPAMKEHGVTIGFVTELYKQAKEAGAVDSCPGSAEEWFEEHRSQIFGVDRGWIRSPWKPLDLKGRLREAMSAVEETNRLLGLARLVGTVQGREMRTLDILAQVRRATSERGEASDGQYVAWGLA